MHNDSRCPYKLQLESNEKLLADEAQSFLYSAKLDWWGGSGSIADVHLHRVGEKPSDEQQQDDRNLRSALINIYEEMKNTGFTDERAESWIYIFREWQRSGL